MNTPTSFKLETIYEKEMFMEMYSKHFPFIRKQAYAYAVKYRQEEMLKDLEQEGVLALVRSVKKFDPTRGTVFLTYFQYWLRLYLFHACVSWMYSIHIPDEQLHRYIKYCKYRKQGKSHDEIADKIGVEKNKLKKVIVHILQAQNITTDNDDVFKTSSRLIDYTPFSECETKMTTEEYISDFSRILTPLEYQIITRYFGFCGEGISLSKLCFELYDKGFVKKVLTRERLRQVKDIGLQKIKDHLGIDVLDRGSYNGHF